jgi:phosphatidylinositol alpha 1,6-mannosyltransferase
MDYPRVAFFTDSFNEVNGVAHTSRQLDAYAQRNRAPFLNVRVGNRTTLEKRGSVWGLELERSKVGIGLSQDMSFDLRFGRHSGIAAQTIKDFGAELIHITGPSDVGFLGARLARELQLPLVASWHTNVHEFASRRMRGRLWRLPRPLLLAMSRVVEYVILGQCIKLYQPAQAIMAPNPELVAQMSELTGRPAFLMTRGVDSDLFNPAKRRRRGGPVRIGYVGRLSPEKDVRTLHDVETALVHAKITDYEFVIVGGGNELAWLKARMRKAQFPGILRGEALADAYASMDLFVFPSHTDTFGNVILEAAASGVPSVVTSSGGPKFTVAHGVSGMVAADDAEIAKHVVYLLQHREQLRAMGLRAREFALKQSWDYVFQGVYEVYNQCARASGAVLKKSPGMLNEDLSADSLVPDATERPLQISR